MVENGLSFFDQKPRLLVGSMIVVFLLAGAVRLYNLQVPGLVSDREYRSALIARAFYFEMTDSVSEWRRDIANASKERAGFLEPPITEFLVSLIYRLANREHLWMARLLTSIFWLIGGVFLFMIARRIGSIEAALISTTYYLFVPLGVFASRTFFPDPLMIMMFLFGLFTIVRYYDKPSTGRLMLAASISGFAILIKPLVLFTLIGAFFTLAISRNAIQQLVWGNKKKDENEKVESNVRLEDRNKAARTHNMFKAVGDLKRVIDGQVLIFSVVSLLPTAIYYGYGIFISDSIDNGARFLPQLLLSLDFWKRWLLTASGGVGHTALIAGLVSLPMLHKGMPGALLTGLWVGYIIFGLVFNNHVRFAVYYHLQLIAIVALSFGPVSTLVINHLRRSSHQWYWWIPVVVALVLTMFFNIRVVQGQLAAHQLFESEDVVEDIGEIVGHSTRTVYLAHHYGTPLEYYGELSGAYWPRSISDRDQALGITRVRSVEERLNKLGFSPEYFIITNLKDYFLNHSDLKEYLERNCSLLAESEQYLIFSDCKR